MNLASIIILIVVVLLFGTVGYREIKKIKEGRFSCGCGGDCSRCGKACTSLEKKKSTGKKH